MEAHALILLIITPTILSLDANNLFENINEKVLEFNAKAAEIAWESSINPGNPRLPEKAAGYQKKRIKWEEQTCGELVTLQKSHSMNTTQERQTYLLCRGPKYNFAEARLLSNIYEELQMIYTGAEICIPSTENIKITNIQQVEAAILKYLTAVKHSKTANDFKMADENFISSETSEEKGFCLKEEEDFEKVMELSRNEAVLKWIWLAWRKKVGPPMKKYYRRLVEVENVGARRNGYQDIGASWRDELEIPRLRQLCRRLYNEIKPLYTLLHGVVRFYLRRFYGNVVPKRGPIPAHLLGNLWSQNWEPLVDLIVPKTIDLDQSIKKLNWTVIKMAKTAEDFYQSFGLPAMTDTFWRESVFAREHKNTRCHGTAADMFKKDDFRLLYCTGTTKEDLYVLHHEMGHIQYFMAYKDQPALFRQANTAFHESIGDAIMYGVMTPQHLHRLRLINDSMLYIFNDGYSKEIESDEINKEANEDRETDFTKEVFNGFSKRKEGNKTQYYGDKNDQGYNEFKDNYIDTNNGAFKTTDDILILKQALNKLPQIPFSLLIDEYRWKYYEGGLSPGKENKIFWEMALELQGIAPSYKRGEKYFDIGAKFHVPDDTPYIRYFLGSFLQHQLFESLCKAEVFGRRTKEELPESIPLHRCDIYGSKTVGKILKDLLSRGHSQHWREILQQVTGDTNISSASLLRYYRPLVGQLMALVRKYKIPIGWDEATSSGNFKD